MKNFFNGAEASEVAGLNTSSTDLNIMVKETLSNPELVERITEVINDESVRKLKTIVTVTGMLLEEKQSLGQYDIDDIWPVTQRRLNTMSRKIAKNHGFTDYMKLVGGAVKKGSLLLESK